MSDVAPSSNRLISLDVLRGLAVIGMCLANATDGVEGGLHAQVFPTLLHERWQGLHFADTVFPTFVMMMGASVALAFGKAKERGVTASDYSKVLWRAFRLVLLGFILVNVDWFANFAATTSRYFGVLQRTGLVYGACGVIYLSFGPKVRLGIIAALLLLYWPLVLLPQMDGGATDVWTAGHNFVSSFDRVMFGAGHHNYRDGPDGYDPEGLLGTIPAIAHGLIGVAVGEFLMKQRGKAASLRLAVAGAGMLAVGCAWGFVFPVIKDIWSSPFVLVTCGLATLVLSGLHVLLDNGKEPKNWLVLFPMAFGLNAIVAYVLDELCWAVPQWNLIDLPYQWLKDAIYQPVAALLPVLLYIVLLWTVVDYLRRRNWIVKI